MLYEVITSIGGTSSSIIIIDKLSIHKKKKRIDILLDLPEHTEEYFVQIRWVHSNACILDGNDTEIIFSIYTRNNFV